MARRALIDATVNTFMFSSILLFFENLRKKKIYKTILFILIYAFTILVKEGSVLLSPFFVLYIFIHRNIFKNSLKLTDFFVVTLFPFTIAGIVYFSLAGGIFQFIDTMMAVVTSPAVNPYAILFCSGPWFRYLIDFMVLSPWVCILAIGFSLNYIIQNERQEEVNYLLLLSIYLLFVFSFFIKNVRYLIVLDMPMRLFAILMLNKLVKQLFKNRPYVILVILVMIISFIDYLNFYNLFIRHGIYDPVSQWLLQANHIIPWK